MWFRRKTLRYKRRRVVPPPRHYRAYREFARAVVHSRLEYFNQSYRLSYKRVSIRNQKTCWGSCSAHGNLNFNYKIVFLPEELMDYVIVHELCHLRHLNHSAEFWKLVSEAIPDYARRRALLRKMTHIPKAGFPSSIARVINGKGERGMRTKIQ